MNATKANTGVFIMLSQTKNVLLNLDLFISRWSTPDVTIFTTMSFIAIYTTLPFQSIINILVGYDMGNFSYIMVPIYIIIKFI